MKSTPHPRFEENMKRCRKSLLGVLPGVIDARQTAISARVFHRHKFFEKGARFFEIGACEIKMPVL
jgi:hypothetical protein